MIILKNAVQLDLMRKAGAIAANALKLAGQALKPGISTLAVDKIIYDYIKSKNAYPSFLHLYNFPNSACISVNDEVIHGLPSRTRILRDGDIVSIDVGAKYKGYHGDNAGTFPVGNISEETRLLLERTNNALGSAVQKAVVGARIGDISSTVEQYCRSFGYGVVLGFCGHGVGADLHEDPEVPNYGPSGKGVRLKAGMTLAVEPMINLSGDEVFTHANGWTVITKSRTVSAHFEHTIAVTENGPEILTVPDL